MLAQLIPVEGGQPITIEKDVTVVGRQSPPCDVALKRKSISKVHCILVKTDGLLFIRDLLSTNGTRVNGQKISRGALLPGDVLSLAGERFRVHLGPKPAPPSAAPALRTQMLDSLPPVPPEIGSADSSGENDVVPLDDSDAPEDLVEE
jgi:pSer/pThr/pTyr-binding forkhead associated (FHA) protein